MAVYRLGSSTMAQIQSLRDRELTEFARELEPPADAIQEANTISDKLFRVLRSNSSYSIDRYVIFGSVAKKTAVRTQYDFDCVVFLNQVQPPFADVISEFEDIITMSTLNATVKSSNDPNRPALSLTIDGLKFDLVPAANFRVSNRNADEQRARTMKAIRSLPNPEKNAHKYNTSLAEYQVQFVAKQTESARRLIRLAKYWNKTVFLSEYISRRTYLIECIATFAASKEDSLYGGFKEFLSCIVNFSNLHVVFDMFYKKHEIDPEIQDQRPLVLDPVNPYINIAKGLEKAPAALVKLQSFAKVTLARVNSQRLETTLDFGAIFQTQPAVAPSEFGDFVRAGSVLVGVIDRNVGASNNPKMTVRVEEKFYKIVASLVQTYLMNNIEIIKGRELSEQRLKEKVKGIVDVNLYGYNALRNWSSSNDRHENCDITFEVPCDNKLIQMSFSWA